MELIGKTFGQYQILEEIGRGGMAVVYKAWQPTLNRYVALKVLSPFLRQDPEFTARFEREARSVANLRHPNIIAVHDAGSSEGVPYIAMEFVEGASLRDRLLQNGGPLEPRMVLSITTQIASALTFAHGQGIIHRDVKPGNILITKEGRAVLTDFGIAQAIGASRLTRTGAMVGTPEYMSPEQIEGQYVDHRTDVYSLGVVVYEMLGGQVPFGGTTPQTVLYGHVHKEPPPLRKQNPTLSRAVEEVVLKALAKKPARRFQQAGELAEALHQTVVSGRPDLAPRTLFGVPARGWVWGLAGAMALLLVIGLLLLTGNGPSGDALTTTAPVTAQVIATSVPLFSTTPKAPTLRATDTPSVPSSTPIVPTDIFEQPTNSPTVPAPVATSRPTSTPIPVIPTPTPAPTVTPPAACSIRVASRFAELWNRSRLGCPTGSVHETWAADQFFQHGYMLWRQDVVRIYVFSNNGTVLRFNDLFVEGVDPDNRGLVPPDPGLQEPRRGFGKVWHEQLGGPSAAIGWATEREVGFDLVVQDYEGGMIFWQDRVGNRIAYWDNGTWEQR